MTSPHSYALDLYKLDSDIRQVRELIEVHEHQMFTETDAKARLEHQWELAELRELLALFEQERTELAEKHRSQPIHFVHGYSLPTIWAEREQELYRLLGEIMSNRYSVLALIAIGGSGKSALVRRLLDELSKQATLFDGALWFNFYVEPSFDRFLVECCCYLVEDFNQTSYPSPFAKAALVRQVLDKHRYLLVMDGIEMLLVDDPNRADYGRFHNLALRDFMRAICQQATSQVLVTSRWDMADLASEGRYHALTLGGLQDKAAFNFMQQQGVKGDAGTISAVTRRYGNHPLTLYILGDYLVRYFEGDIKHVSQLDALPQGTSQGVLLQSILDGYWANLRPEERFFMTRLAAFRGGVAEDALQVLTRNKPQSTAFVKCLEYLANSALLNTEQVENRRIFTAHALVKTYFYDRMGQEEQRKTHVELKNYAEGKPLLQQIRTLSELEPLLDACYHCIKAGLYKDAYTIFAGRELLKPLLHLCQYDRALEILVPLIEATQAESSPSKLTLNDLGWLHNSAAIMFANSGRLQHALVHYRSALAITELLDDWDNVIVTSLNMADLMMQMGRLEVAFEMLEKPNELIKAYPALRFKAEDVLLGRLGRYYALAGQHEKAQKMYADAINRSVHQGNPRALCQCYIWQGELCLESGDSTAALDAIEKALKITKRQKYMDYQGHALKVEADMHRQAYDFPEALQHYQEALKIAEDVGYRLLQVEALLGLAKLNQDLGDLAGAQTYGQRALHLAQESDLGLHRQQARAILDSLSTNPTAKYA
jgi:tetratricopeptide (TPR) repeat protein